ncbi:MAG: MBL fold metallo-hydrolase, partial [Spirochaetota bacterium]
MSRIGLVIVAAMLALVVPAHAHALEEPPVVATPDRDTTIREISDGVYVVTHAFPWPANSLIVLCGDGDAAMIDTPYTPEATRLVLEWLFATHGDRNVVAVVTGFHFDNLGGVSELRDRGIPVWGSDRTAELIHERGEESREL